MKDQDETKQQLIEELAALRKLLAQYVLIRDEAGKPVAESDVVADIAARNQAEEALRKSEERFCQYFKLQSIGIAITSRDKRWIEINDRLCELFGYSREELLQLSWTQLTYPDDLASNLDLFNEAIAGKRDGYSLDKRFIRKDGSVIYVNLSVRCVRRSDGQVDYFLSLYQDITKRKQAEDALRESEERFRNLIEGSIQGIVIDQARKPVFVNQSFVDILGYESAAEILAMESLDPCVASYERVRLRAYTEARLKGKDAPTQYEYNAVRKDGSVVTLQNVARVVKWKGEPAIQSTVIDITERKQAERALRASEERYRALYDDNPSMYFTIDQKGTVLSVNPFGAQQLGYTGNELVRTSFVKLFRSNDRTTVREMLDGALRDPDRLHRWEMLKVRKDGDLFWARETARVTEGADGRKVILIVCEDITEAHRLSEKLSYQASHDSLTGLVNRREFEQRLERVLRSAQAEETKHALCYLDLDQFKVINDICGHIAGDELLRQLSQLLAGKVRKRDTLARLGGDEFGVLMEHCSLQQAERVATALKKAIQDFRFVWEEKIFSIGVSIGLVPIVEANESVTSVLSMADAACYAAKDAGRNRIHVYRGADIDFARRHREMQLVSRINQALDQDHFHLAFQPIALVTESGDQREHYELLLRMEDEAGRIVPPSAFLAAAERYSLSAKLDRWVIGTAFRWLTRHPRHLECLYLCSINLSGLSLGDKEFLKFIVQELDATKIPPEKVCFEITETAAIANLENATRFIKALKEKGCRFALDDFGSGLSSFAYLKNLPVDFLKIDGVFVRDIVDDPIAFAMVRSINEIGRVMGKRTIAEFVENDAILEKLREIGVDYAQGYGICRPQPLAEMRSLRVAGTGF